METEPKSTKEEIINTWFAVTVLFQFAMPGLLTFIVTVLKLSSLVLVDAPWVYVLLPFMVSVSVGIALISLILLIKLFTKLEQ